MLQTLNSDFLDREDTLIVGFLHIHSIVSMQFRRFHLFEGELQSPF